MFKKRFILLGIAVSMLISLGYAQQTFNSNIIEGTMSVQLQQGADLQELDKSNSDDFTNSYSYTKAPETNQNFRKLPTLPMTSYSRGSNAYGYFHYPENAYTTFDVDNFLGYTQVSSEIPTLFGGSYYNGFLYAYENTAGVVVFHKIEATTGEIVNSVSRPELNGQIVSALSFDYTQVRMYAVMDNVIYTVNLTTGELTVIVNIALSHIVLNMAIDLYGTMYVVQAGTSNLYEVNKTTGAVRLIGSTGRAGVNYAQSMAFDYSNGKLYWNECTIYSTSNFLEINVNTGWATLIQGNTVEVTSFFIPFTAYSQEAPNAITNFTGTQGPSGALNALLSWTNPSTTVAGDPLTDLSEVKIYQDGELIHTVTNPVPGQVSSYNVSVTEDALYTFIIVPENSDGEGVRTRYYLYIGEDLPGAATAITLTSSENNGIINWTAPTTGFHDGWFDVSSLTYTVTRLPDNVEMTTGLIYTTFTDNTIDDINLYSYKITSVNAAGIGGAAISNELIIGDPISAPYFISYEDGEVWQIWTFDNENEVSGRWYRENDRPTFSNTGVAVMTYQWGPTVGNSWMFSPPLKFEADKAYKINFWTRSLNNYQSEKLKIFVATDQTPESVIGEAIYDNDDIFGERYNETELHLFDYPEGVYTLGFYCYSNPNSGILFIDDFSMKELSDKDASAEKLYGPLKPMVGKQFRFKAIIRNEGLTNISGYTVKLIDENDNVLAINNIGTEVLVNESLTVDILWTPTTAGNFSVRAFVDLEDDGVSYNDITPAIEVTVQPAEDLFSGTIGTGTMLNDNMPISVPRYSSAAQSIYFDHELIGQPAAIEEVQYFYNFLAPSMFMPIKILMANTEQSQLNEWIPESEFQVVFDGTVTISPPGPGNISIVLDNPFLYDGKNLVIMIIKTDMATMGPPNQFVVSQTPDFPARTLYWNDFPMNVFNWSQTGTQSNLHPNTVLKMSFDGGSVSGIVTDLDSNPLEGAKVQIEGTNIIRTTNEEGEYSFDLLLPGEYVFVASKIGFLDETSDPETVELDMNTVVDFALTPMTSYTLSGKVTGSDAPSGVANVLITLTGYANYSTYSDANGDYSIPNVYDGFVYTLTAKKVGYKTYSEVVEIDGGNETHNFLLIEIILPPMAITAEEVGENAEITWLPPVSGYETIYILDDGSAEAGFRINVSTDASFGNIYVNNDTGVITNVEVYGYWDSAGEESRTVTMEIFNADREFLGVSEPFILPGDEWVNVELDFVPYQGTFYAMVRWSVEPTQTHHLGYDMDGPNSEKALSYIIDNQGWRNFSYISNAFGVFLIRVNAITTDNKVTYGYDNQETTNEQDLNQSRALTGYSLYRLQKDQDEEDWTEIVESTTALQYIDNEWSTLASGEYQYAVKAKYTNNIFSKAVLSNSLDMGMNVDYEITITTNTGVTAEGAIVTLTNQNGNANNVYTGEADENGVVTLTIRKGTYDLKIKLVGFQFYIEYDIEILTQGLTYSAMLYEIPYPVVDPLAVDKTTFAEITWGEPAGPVLDIFRYDSGICGGQLGASQGGTRNTLMGSAHRVSASLEKMSWYSTDNVVHTAYDLWVLELNASGNPTNKVLFTVQSVQNTPLQWCNYEFPNPIDAPNGFFIAVSPSAGGFTSIGTDSPNAEYPFQPNTNFVSMNYITGEFFAIEDVGDFPFNFMIRAEGYTMGKATRFGFPELSIATTVNTNNIENNVIEYIPTIPFITEESSGVIKGSKTFSNYIIYRLKDGQQSDESLWTSLSDDLDEPSFSDNGWATVEPDVYRWAIKAEYSGEVLSIPMFTNTLAKDMEFPFTINLTTNTGESVTGAKVQLTNLNGNPAYSYSAIATSPTVFFEKIWRGTYDIFVQLDGFYSYTNKNFVIDEEGLSLDVDLVENKKPVRNPVAAIAGNNVAITWQTPIPDFFNWINWCVNDVIAGTIGYDDDAGEDMTAAMRFTPNDLASKGVVSGHAITKIALGVGTHIDRVNLMEIKIWEGGSSVTNAGQLVYTQTITDLTKIKERAINIIDLTTPFIIDASKELRIGWRLINEAGYPFGYDAGPAVSQKGTLFQCPSLFNGAWVCHLNQMQWNFNYVIKAWISSEEGESVTNIGTDRSFNNYSVYRLIEGSPESDWFLLSDNVAGLTYTDTDWQILFPAYYQWAVKANYTSGQSESKLTNELEKKESNINVNDISNIVLYPNPFTNEIIISAGVKVKNVEIMNLASQKIRDINFDGKSISTGDLANGVYFVVIESITGEKATYKVVKK